MSKENLDDLVLISSTENNTFAQNVANYLDKELAEVNSRRFADSDLKLRIGDDESVRGHHAALLMTYEPPISDRLHETIVWTDALMSGSLKSLTIVWPFFLGSRQDRKTARGEPINIRAYIHAVEGVASTQVAKLGWMTADLHAPQCEGYSMKFDNFSAFPLFAHHIKTHFEDPLIVSPDIGGLKNAYDLAKLIGADTPTHVPKLRDVDGSIVVENGTHDTGMYRGRDIIVPDDMIDTAGTLLNVGRFLQDAQAHSVHSYASHFLNNGPARERLAGSGIKVNTTDSVYHKPGSLHGVDLEIISIAPLIGEALRRHYLGISTRELRKLGAWDTVFGNDAI